MKGFFRCLGLAAAFLATLMAAPSLVRAQFTFITNADNTLTLTAYAGTDQNLVIPASANGYPVTCIGTNVFYGQNFAAVVIPEGVTTIGTSAFEDCFNLTHAYLPNSLTSIGPFAFYICQIMTNAPLGNNVTNIGDYAFSLTVLNSVIFPNSLLSIGAHAYDGCKMGQLVFGTNLVNIPDYAFCVNSLHSLTIPDMITNIGNWAFFYSGYMNNVVIGRGVTTIGSSAFSDSYLINLTILGNVTNWGDQVFYQNTSLANVTLGNGFTTVPGGLFQNFSSLTNISMPDTLTSIGANAFANCYRLQELTIPDSVLNIGSGAFANCYQLEELTVPASVTNIGDTAFNSIPFENGVYFEGNAPNTGLSTVGFGSDPYNYPTIYYLPGTTGWGPTFSGRPAVEWNPQAVTTDGFFGVRTNVFGFNMTGNSNVMVVVQVATNLGNPVWQSLGTNMFSNRPIYFSDPQWTNSPNRFYRFRSP